MAAPRSKADAKHQPSGAIYLELLFFRVFMIPNPVAPKPAIRSAMYRPILKESPVCGVSGLGKPPGSLLGGLPGSDGLLGSLGIDGS